VKSPFPPTDDATQVAQLMALFPQDAGEIEATLRDLETVFPDFNFQGSTLCQMAVFVTFLMRRVHAQRISIADLSARLERVEESLGIGR
jgi:hypothetical protein